MTTEGLLMKGCGVMGSNSNHRLHVWQLCVALAAILFALVCAPSTAFARSYTVDAVDIDASVDIMGGVWVTEEHTYTFHGAYNSVELELPSGTFEGRRIEPQVYEIAIEAGGETTLFFYTDDIQPTEGFKREDGTYAVTITRAVEDETATYKVSYLLPKLVNRWADVAEIYWQYVPADPDGDVWHNVTLEVTLPVSQGETVTPGENVRAWGHGPLAGEVTVTASGATFTCPVVEGDDFLEARVVFPESWVGAVDQADEAKLETILEEEAAWAEQANAKRVSDRAWAYGVPGAMIAVGVGGVVLEQIRSRFRRRKSPEATFSEEYLRDVPNDDHPVVWGLLMDEGVLDNDDFAATLMRLCDEGLVSVDAVYDDNGKYDWRITRTGKTAQSQGDAGFAAVDEAALKLLFETVPEALGEPDATSVLISQFNKAAKKKPRAYNDAFYAWANAAREAYKACELEREDSRGDDMVVGTVGLLLIPLAVVLAIIGIFVSSPNWLLMIGIFVCFGGAIWCIWNYDVPSSETYLTQRGADLKAQLEALRRWLTDFTNLEESIPTDVALWNRLLVAATVLGVAKEVVRKLRVRMPALFKDERFVGSSLVVRADEDDDGSVELLFTAFAGAIAAGVATASSKLGSSSSSSSYGSSYDTRDSSSSGSGGGFSDGGGGGFSGRSGRGGAF